MVALIRDDDVNVSTSVDDLRFAYGKIIEEVPINFFIIPRLEKPSTTFNSKNSDFFWANLNASGSILDNSKLINYLANGVQNDKFGVGLHGFHHSYREFTKQIDEKQFLRGCDEMKSVFGDKLSAFSPPNNSINRKNVKIVSKAFKHLFISFGPWLHERDLSFGALVSFLRLALIKYSKNPYKYLFQSSPRAVSGHYEYPSLPVFYGQSSKLVFDSIDAVNPHHDGVICLATHFYDLQRNECTRWLLEKSINTLKDKGVKFITIQQLKTFNADRKKLIS
jgi:peptidoglycan/xylan/chitin deacetylase (PgdA/CDA1 family)